MRRIAWAGLLTILVFLLSLARTAVPNPASAEPIPEETRRLLEKSLSVVEIDREIRRISELRDEAKRKIEAGRRQLAELEAAAAAHREQSDEVLRAYYMGRREWILAALLNVHSLSELLRTWEMMELILQSDRAALDAYARHYEQVRDQQAALLQDAAELAVVESNLHAQRERLLSLQEEIGRALAASGNEAYLRELMAELESYWKNVGLYEVKRKFRSLAEAMQRLPAWIQENPDMMETKGLTTTLTVTDERLNGFLRSHDDAFESLEIRFEEDRMILAGESGTMQVEIAGHYTIVEEPENAILFHVDRLLFNGLELPDTTRADLEREFDLGFYPQKLVKFVKAQSVKLEPGRLIVELGIG